MNFFEDKVKLYFDCEMTSLSTDGDLVSIGIVSGAKGDMPLSVFYAEVVDVKDYGMMDEWVEKNVYEKLVLRPSVMYSLADNDKDSFRHQDELAITTVLKDKTLVLGTWDGISRELRLWMKRFDMNNVTFVTDCGNSVNGDWHHLLTLLAEWDEKTDETKLEVGNWDQLVGLPKLPENILPICDDIVYRMSSYFKRDLAWAWDVSRESLVVEHLGNIPDVYGKFAERKEDVQKHNALWDAQVIRLIDERMDLDLNWKVENE